MKRLPLFVLLLGVAAAFAAPPAAASSSVSIGVRIGNAPPPPVVVWRRPPTLVVVPGTDVYCYHDDLDYDYFRYGNSYYIWNDGYWYRAPGWRGPFVVVRQEYVPRVFYGIHDRGYRWRHDWARREMARDRREDRREVRRDERRERKEHKEHGRGHDKHGGD